MNNTSKNKPGATELPGLENELKVTKLFSNDNDEEYIIPLYQRAYAWSEPEIEQLLLDIYTIDDDCINDNEFHYYIGTLVVNKRPNNKYEVIDGQQRLTTLYLLLTYLKYTVNTCSLSFDCRQESYEALLSLKNFINSDNTDSISNGFKIISNYFENEKIGGKNINKNVFKKKLEKVVIFRLQVPPYTDLNHYFEIMNTRGEQLAQADILKSNLMSLFKKTDNKGKTASDIEAQDVFSTIWDACSDMNHYVQLGFSTDLRAEIFGNNWDNCPTKETINFANNKNSHEDQESNRFEDLIKNADKNIFVAKASVDDNNQSNENGYNSIINFDYFLLHVVRIYIHQKKFRIELGSLLNDINLTKDYYELINNNNFDIRDFTVFLLQCRYLFDRYIIKRYCSSSKDDGEWRIYKFFKNDKNSNPYGSTFSDKNNDEENESIKPYSSNCKMLQSCLRVSITSPKVMHWITYFLEYLLEHFLNANEDKSNDIDFLKKFNDELERYIKFGYVNNDEMKTNFQSVSDSLNNYEDYSSFSEGVGTPRLVLNYLDYLLWKDKKIEIPNKSSFKFEFRNSVEHWYPQNPNPNDGLVEWDKVNQFGNLALLQRGLNSHFSNLSPDNKKEYVNRSKSTMSLKLILMKDATNGEASWRSDDCKKHGEEMFELLKKALQ